jgi:hypothetical protein
LKIGATKIGCGNIETFEINIYGILSSYFPHFISIAGISPISYILQELSLQGKAMKAIPTIYSYEILPN